jgi:thioredoxin 2
MAPNFAGAAAKMPSVRFVKVDSDAAPIASAQYRIRSIPTLVLFEHGLEKDRMSGVLSTTDLLAWLAPRIAARGA